MTAYLGPVGGLVRLKCPSALNLGQVREQSLTTTSGGRRVAFRAPRSHRSWSVDTSAATPAEVTAVQALEEGIYGPPPWHWIDPWAQIANALTPASSTFGAGTFWGGGSGPLLSDAPVDLGGGHVVRRSLLIPEPSASTGFANAVNPVVPGVPVTVSIYGAPVAEGAYLRVWFQDEAGNDLVGHVGNATTGVGAIGRVAVTATPPAGAVKVRAFVVNFSRIACPQLTWTPQVRPWAIGQGAAAVVLEGIGATALRTVRTTPTQQLGANSFQIIEVG